MGKPFFNDRRELNGAHVEAAANLSFPHWLEEVKIKKQPSGLL